VFSLHTNVLLNFFMHEISKEVANKKLTNCGSEAQMKNYSILPYCRRGVNCLRRSVRFLGEMIRSDSVQDSPLSLLFLRPSGKGREEKAILQQTFLKFRRVFSAFHLETPGPGRFIFLLVESPACTYTFYVHPTVSSRRKYRILNAHEECIRWRSSNHI
jgi:hypothetical protein